MFNRLQVQITNPWTCTSLYYNRIIHLTTKVTTVIPLSYSCQYSLCLLHHFSFLLLFFCDVRGTKINASCVYNVCKHLIYSYFMFFIIVIIKCDYYINHFGRKKTQWDMKHSQLWLIFQRIWLSAYFLTSVHLSKLKSRKKSETFLSPIKNKHFISSTD